MALLAAGCEAPEASRAFAIPAEGPVHGPRVTPFATDIEQGFRLDGDHAVGVGAFHRVTVERSGRLVATVFPGAAPPTTMTLEPAVIRRGGDSVVAADPELELYDGRVRFVTSNLEAIIRNGRESFEQRWRFQREPAGSGDLVVSLQVGGADLVSTVPDGLTLIHQATGAGVRYGHGTWIDAAGRSTHVAATWLSGRIELRVPDDVIAGSSYPAILDPIISPEFETDDIAATFAFGDQNDADIAFHGGNYLVVFEDGVAGLVPNGVYGARLTPEGAVLDVPSFLIAEGGGGARLACASGGCLVVWAELAASVDIKAARVTGDGTVLDDPPLVIAAGAYHELSPEVASNGSDFLVVWHADVDAAAGLRQVRARRVAADGSLPDAGELTIGTAGSRVLPSVASSGSDYVVVWPETTGVGTDAQAHARRVTEAGVLLDGPNGIQVSRSTARVTQVTAGWSGAHYTVAWRHATSSVRAARLTAAGTLLDPADITVASSFTTDAFTFIDVGCHSGDACLIVWQGAPGLAGQFLAGSGSLGRSLTFGSTSVATERNPHVVPGGPGQMAVVYDAAPTGAVDTDVWAERIDVSTGFPSVEDEPPLLVSQGGNRQEFAAAASFDGVNTMLLWNDRRTGPRALRGVVISPAGDALDSEGFEVLPGLPTSGGATVLAPVFDGTNHLISYLEGSSASAIRVSTTGTLVDTSPFQVAPSARSVRAARTGLHTVVVWEDTFVIRAARVNDVGAVLDVPGVVISSFGFDPYVSFDGGNLLVAWHEGRVGRGSEIFGLRVTPDLVPLDAAPLPIVSASADQTLIGLSYDGENHVLTWKDYRLMGNPVVSATRVTTEGAILDATGRPILGEMPEPPAALSTFDGVSHVVVYLQPMEFSPGDLVGVRFDRALDLLDAAPFEIVVDIDSTPFSLSRNAAGTSVVLYETFDLDDRNRRVHGRYIRNSADGATCGAPTDCDSGFCVDDVCCDARCGDGDDSDCQACSVSTGAPTDGTCAPLAAATVCRASSGAACDVDETCDGTVLVCPPDDPIPGCGVDAGMDAGAADAAVADSGAADASASDAGAGDAGTADTGTIADGAPSDAEDGDAGGGGGGGGCAALPATGSTTFAALIALLIAAGVRKGVRRGRRGQVTSTDRRPEWSAGSGGR